MYALRGHDPAPLFDDRALERRLLPGVAYDFLEVMAVENAAHDVLGTRLGAALEEGNLQPSFGHW